MHGQCLLAVFLFCLFELELLGIPQSQGQSIPIWRLMIFCRSRANRNRAASSKRAKVEAPSH